MKLSIVMSTCNRSQIFDLSLRSLAKQYFDRKEMELIVVDDGSTEDILGLLSYHKNILHCPIKYIRIDSSKSEIPVFGHTPALSNNIGFKDAQGKIILLQGNDMIHCNPNNLFLGVESAGEDKSVFAECWTTSKEFAKDLLADKSWVDIHPSLEWLLDKPGAKADDIIKRGWYWYILFVKREYIMKINGVDEEYLRGVYAEDDNFAYRLQMAGANHYRHPQIYALHLWHFDEKLEKQQRFNLRWNQGARINRIRWNQFLRNPRMTANENRDWGSDKVITKYEIL